MERSDLTLPVSWHPRGPDERPTIGSWLTIPSPTVAEIMARAGFDWLVVDMEHSAIGLNQAQELIRVIHLCKLPALVRVGENNPNLIKRVMDAGASGVIVPMVNNVADARQAVASVKYAPKGKRGVGLARAQGYGPAFEAYWQWVVSESAVIVQIEHIKAVENLQAILSVEGVNGFIVGPYDLSSSLGVPGQFEHPRVQSALQQVCSVIDQGFKPAGFHVVQPDPEDAANKLQAGYSFLAFGVDFLYLGEMCRNQLSKLRESIG